MRACVCVCVCMYVCVCVCVCVHIIHLSHDAANGNTPILDQVGSVVPCTGFASQQQGYIMHTHHTMREAMLAPGPDF